MIDKKHREQVTITNIIPVPEKMQQLSNKHYQQIMQFLIGKKIPFVTVKAMYVGEENSSYSR